MHEEMLTYGLRKYQLYNFHSRNNLKIRRNGIPHNGQNIKHALW